MKKRNRHKRIQNSLIRAVMICLISAMTAAPLGVLAAPKSGAAETTEELEANAEERKSLPIQSNETAGWPAGPEIGAESAILMDVDTGTVLYSKNIHEQLYPASTTKLLTCLIAGENGNMSDMVTFSYDAVHSVPSDGSNIGMDAGQSITLEQCMYGILVGSANEAANAVAEYTAGSVSAFVDMMNEKAEELGCEDSHFNNTNGLQDENHYTSAYDLALIAREYFSNDTLARYANTARYHFEPTDTQPDDFWIKNKHELINGDIPYDGIKGGKTGYTDDARQTLVTCCEQNGMRLVCVVMMEESPDQFNDTVTLFNYGFSNFSLVKVSDYETRYTVNSESFFKTGSDIFGNSQPFLTINGESRIIMPANVDFKNLTTDISYDTQDAVAQIFYSYNGVSLGSALVETLDNKQPEYDFEHVDLSTETKDTGFEIKSPENTVFINVKTVVLAVAAVSLAIIIIITIVKISRDYHFSGRADDRRRRRVRGRRRKKTRFHGEFSDYDF